MNTRAQVTSLLDRGERWLRPADRTDYLIRRRLVPVWHEASAPQSTLTEFQAEIGRRLRAAYDIALPVPPRLVDLLRELEGRSDAERGVA